MDFTQAPEIIAALVAQLRTLSGVHVSDGQPLALDSADMIAVGFSPTGEASVTVAQEASGLDFNRRAEALSIVCLASALRGGTDMAQRRVECVSIMDRAKAAIGSDPTLGGTCTRAGLGFGVLFDQAQTPDGAMVSAEFTVLAETL